MTMEAETGVIQPQAQELPEARPVGKEPPLETLEGVWPCDAWILAFQPPGLGENAVCIAQCEVMGSSCPKKWTQPS